MKSKSRYVRSNSKSLGNHVVRSEKKKERLQWEGFAEKGLKSGMKERVGDKKLIIITNPDMGKGPRERVGPSSDRTCAMMDPHVYCYF